MKQINISTPQNLLLKTKKMYCEDDIYIVLDNITNLTPGNLKHGVKVLGIVGTYKGGGFEECDCEIQSFDGPLNEIDAFNFQLDTMIYVTNEEEKGVYINTEDEFVGRKWTKLEVPLVPTVEDVALIQNGKQGEIIYNLKDSSFYQFTDKFEKLRLPKLEQKSEAIVPTHNEQKIDKWNDGYDGLGSIKIAGVNIPNVDNLDNLDPKNYKDDSLVYCKGKVYKLNVINNKITYSLFKNKEEKIFNNEDIPEEINSNGTHYIGFSSANDSVVYKGASLIVNVNVPTNGMVELLNAQPALPNENYPLNTVIAVNENGVLTYYKNVENEWWIFSVSDFTEVLGFEPEYTDIQIPKNGSDGFSNVTVKGVKVVNVYELPTDVTNFELGNMVNFEDVIYILSNKEPVEWKELILDEYQSNTITNNGEIEIVVPEYQAAKKVKFNVNVPVVPIETNLQDKTVKANFIPLVVKANEGYDGLKTVKLESTKVVTVDSLPFDENGVPVKPYNSLGVAITEDPIYFLTNTWINNCQTGEQAGATFETGLYQLNNITNPTKWLKLAKVTKKEVSKVVKESYTTNGTFEITPDNSEMETFNKVKFTIDVKSTIQDCSPLPNPSNYSVGDMVNLVVDYTEGETLYSKGIYKVYEHSGIKYWVAMSGELEPEGYFSPGFNTQTYPTETQNFNYDGYKTVTIKGVNVVTWEKTNSLPNIDWGLQANQRYYFNPVNSIKDQKFIFYEGTSDETIWKAQNIYEWTGEKWVLMEPVTNLIIEKEYTENGEYDVISSDGFAMNSVKIKVNVASEVPEEINLGTNVLDSVDDEFHWGPNENQAASEVHVVANIPAVEYTFTPLSKGITEIVAEGKEYTDKITGVTKIAGSNAVLKKVIVNTTGIEPTLYGKEKTVELDWYGQRVELTENDKAEGYNTLSSVTIPEVTIPDVNELPTDPDINYNGRKLCLTGTYNNKYYEKVVFRAKVESETITWEVCDSYVDPNQIEILPQWDETVVQPNDGYDGFSSILLKPTLVREFAPGETIPEASKELLGKFAYYDADNSGTYKLQMCDYRNPNEPNDTDFRWKDVGTIGPVSMGSVVISASNTSRKLTDIIPNLVQYDAVDPRSIIINKVDIPSISTMPNAKEYFESGLGKAVYYTGVVTSEFEPYNIYKVKIVDETNLTYKWVKMVESE